MSTLAYSIVIPTLELPDELDRTLAGIATQTRPPLLTIVVDSSAGDSSRVIVEKWAARIPLRYEHTKLRSAAEQRNLGGQLVNAAASPVVAFIDDDITLPPEAGAKVCEVFDGDAAGEVGGLSVRIAEIHRPRPSGWSWWYYRLQAGYADATYGGKLFGPAINCLPCYSEDEPELIPAQWLNSGCVFYRTTLFQRERFPRFEGYSFMEDVHLSARIGQTHRLYFHRTLQCSHRDGAATRPQTDRAQLARMRIRNQRLVARDVMGLSGPGFEAKLLLHRLFVTISILRHGGRERWQELLGTWT